VTWLAQRRSLAATAHRPWPLPGRRWLMGQSWADVLFCHWPVAPEALRPHVPDRLPLDLAEGAAWISLAAFEVRATRPHGLPPPPVVGRFPELNVRTYVSRGGRPGIFFLSLDAASAPAVAAARRLYRLPYLRAEIEILRDGPWTRYRSERRDRRGAPTRFAARWRPAGAARSAAPGSLEAWLVERYRLYTADVRGALLAGDIHHRPWTLRDAEAAITANTMTAGLGIDLAGAPLVQHAARVDALFWALERVG
jgi:uncharacterized protein YqjF (DUF2071 family)